MIQTVNWYTFHDWFQKSDTYKNNFSYNGLKALFDYLEDEPEASMMEFDPIALCCEYSEYPTALECAENYGFTDSYRGMEDDPAKHEIIEAEALEWLQERTQVITFDGNVVDGGGIIIQQF